MSDDNFQYHTTHEFANCISNRLTHFKCMQGMIIIITLFTKCKLSKIVAPVYPAKIVIL